MVAIHAVHRRLAELAMKAKMTGGSYERLSLMERQELVHCLSVNLELVRKLDSLKSLAFLAYEQGDMVWHNEICEKLDELEAGLM
ncbi:DUF7667 family protein [Paenibacillus soyae]|uniref:Uncharacterized protein n=1 Tax=Paenibacillus soyae TaxID=2969249 RepID=A0A9X2MPK9_9BACL|nr:hypothetical protein [Paenibacillus soyae]MCR2804549.1 hypothetical protein [Paenibacillus soyae]